MKIVGLAVVKNEVDIIEAMVRHNLFFLDQLHIVDNGSTDGCYEVLQLLKEEGLNITVEQDHTNGHIQTEIINNLVNQKFINCHLFLLDGDEFILAKDRAAIEELFVNENVVFQLPWQTYVPHINDNLSEANPLVRIKYRRKREAPAYYKTTVPSYLKRPVLISAGNHSIGKMKSEKSLNVKLAHFPIRSIEQLASKALIGSWNLRLKKRSPNEGYQWTDLAKRFTKDGLPNYSELCDIAVGYAAKRDVRLMRDPIEFKFSRLEYLSLSKDNLFRNMAHFIEVILKENIEFNKM